jgi:hypothetical protein
MNTLTTYGPGGYDPAKPDGNVIAVETFDAPPEAPPTADERLAALEAELRDVKGRLAAAERRKP